MNPKWSPWLQRDIDTLEDVQKRVVRMTSGLKGTNYSEKLLELGLWSLEDRRKRGDTIQVWKVLHGHDDVKEETWFRRISRTGINTRLSSSPFNLELTPAKLDIRKQFFSVRVISPWNALPDIVKAAGTLNCFKNLYDNYYMENQSR